MINITKNFTDASMAKQLPFALAMALTRTARDAQKEIISAGLPGAFTVRGSWYLPSNAFGVKVTRATKQKPIATVGTMADWLELQEEGGTKRPSGAHVAVPTANVKRNKRDIIVRSQRPRSFRDAFVIKGKSGPLLVRRLYQNRAGKYTSRKLKRSLGSRLVVLFGLETSVRIKRRSGFIDPARAEINRTLEKNFEYSLEFAMKTAR